MLRLYRSDLLGQRPLALGARPHQRVEKSLGRVHTLEVVGHLPAEEAVSDRLIGIALDSHRATFAVDRHEHRASVWTVVRARRVHNPALAHSSGMLADQSVVRQPSVNRPRLR